MANKLITMIRLRLILQSLNRGQTVRSIARQLHISRKTVAKYAGICKGYPGGISGLLALDDSALKGILQPKPVRPYAQDDQDKRMALDLCMEYFISELKRTGVTRRLLWSQYYLQNPEGYSYSQFCEHLKTYKFSPGAMATMHFNYEPGKLVMVDLAGDKMHYTDPDTAEVISCPVLVCVLPFSGYSYTRALSKAAIEQLVGGMNGCLNYFGGVPGQFKTDNMRQVVIRVSRYEPGFTQTMEEWAHHNNIELLVARVAKPRDKARVENEVRLTYMRIYAPLRDKVFFSLEELNAAIDIQREYHHSQPMQRMNLTRAEAFNQLEKKFLQPLPGVPFQIMHQTQSKVQRNYHIMIGEDKHFYSVPYTYIGKTLRIIYNTEVVEIYSGHERIVTHERNYRKNGYTTLAAHMPEAHRHMYNQQGWDQHYFLDQGRLIGPGTAEYIERMLTQRRFTQQSFNARPWAAEAG
jgi:transposase